ncbi:mechanosensitive ion channel family protein [Chitinimonas sp. BJB300]|uniref:mechanosensitive ion channel family protein n=1 Tax=Chitinimonas sp. BJB300 TaxID=1559339 RepID=UPI000C114F98|nr:mechanosensitive ion channel domain-containing protein [Chitinimonas sp. BJB300]PHV09718.1 mechanosensitive ion channel protein MscS [Chitinimonas sp. BJB300]TSJ91417.1 mechanosensitive ion channel [Chitinimonas sp. BJB300]
MQSNLRATPLYDFLEEFQRAGLTEPHLGMQLLVLLGSAILAWVFSRLLRPKLRKSGAENWRFGSEGIARLLFPLLFWLSVELATFIWREGHSVTLLRLSTSLLSTMVLVRAAVYLLQEVFAQSVWIRRAIPWVAGVLWLGFALHITGLLPEIQTGLDSVSFNIGKQRISILLILHGLISIAITMLFTLWLGRLFEQRMMGAQSINLSLRVVITKIVRTLLIIVGVMIALPLVGIDLTVLSVFSGALGVGLGFGLQKIASNYVSGFIILLDGSIRIGDLVNIDNRQGTITAITSRYVLLKLGDGTEAIIPNETLITNTVLNLSHSDHLLRVVLPVQVAYDTDLEHAISLLIETTHNEARILTEPIAQVFVKGFGESGIDLELAFWIVDPGLGTAALRSQLNIKIWKSFAQHGIEIPYPRRDLHLISPVNISPNVDASQSSSAR